jgi:hypothetical protein
VCSSDLAVYLHVRYSDDCGNSLRCGIDDSPRAFAGNTKIYDEWLWELAGRRFRLAPGFHRLILQTSEDGLEFDQAAILEQPPGDEAELDRLARTPAPAFERLPPWGGLLPELGAVTAQAFASDSLVIGAGHRNTLTVWVRLNGAGPVSGEIEVRSARGQYADMRRFRLEADRRAEILTWDLPLSPHYGYFVPVEVRVLTTQGCVHAQSLSFIRPLAWAFLGPFPDPGRQGLNLALPPDDRLAELHRRPAFPGRGWTVVEDGSCYDEFGVVDLNKVFGLPNLRWDEQTPANPMVAYAVTVVRTAPSHHMPLAFAGDDCVQVWLNGRLLLRQEGNAPLETGRMVVGVETPPGFSRFVFKVPQTRFYWQLLFEPDPSRPYSHPDFLQPVPVAAWALSRE